MLLRISRRQRTNVRKSEEIPRWRARNEKASFTVAKLYLSFLMKCLFIPFYSVFFTGECPGYSALRLDFFRVEGIARQRCDEAHDPVLAHDPCRRRVARVRLGGHG